MSPRPKKACTGPVFDEFLGNSGPKTCFFASEGTLSIPEQKEALQARREYSGPICKVFR